MRLQELRQEVMPFQHRSTRRISMTLTLIKCTMTEIEQMRGLTDTFKDEANLILKAQMLARW
jgi:hypothetical protein